MKYLIKRWEGPMIDNTYAYVWSRPGGTVRHWFWSCFNLFGLYISACVSYTHLLWQIYVLSSKCMFCCFNVSHASFTCRMIIYSLWIVYMCVYSTVYKLPFYLSYASHLWLMLSVLDTTLNKAYSILYYSILFYIVWSRIIQHLLFIWFGFEDLFGQFWQSTW